MNKYAIGLALIVTAFIAGRYMSPEKLTESIKTVEVVKWKTRVVRTTKPDGTIIEETIEEAIRERIKDKHIVFDAKKYLVSLSGTPQSDPTYMLSVSKKFILGTYLGVTYNGKFGLAISYRF